MQAKQELVTASVAEQKMKIALTKIQVSIQALQDKAISLVINDNEDNLREAKEFLDSVKKATKEIDARHKEGKAPHLEAGKAWDEAKRVITKAIDEISAPISLKYNKVCTDIERKKADAAAEKARNQAILNGIEQNIITFSQKIAACDTAQKLVEIEKLLGLEKSSTRKNKYGEFHDQAIAKYDEVLIPLIRDQKVAIKQKEELQAKLIASETAEEADQIAEKLAEKENEIIYNAVKVQEEALNLSMEVIEPEIIVPMIKARRTNIEAEIVDVAVVFKKNPHLLDIALKLAEAKKVGSKLMEEGKLVDIVTVDGIKYTVKKVY